MASNPSRTHDKFEPRGITCLFLGYPLHQKGYKLMNLLTKQVYVSRDVQFYEHIFPYHKDSYQQYMQPIPNVVTKHKDICLDDILLQMSSSEDSITMSPVETTASQSNVQQFPLTVNDFATAPPNTVVQRARRSTRTKKPLAWMTYFATKASASIPPNTDNIDTSLAAAVSFVEITPSCRAFLASLDSNCDPIIFSKAVKDVK